MKTSKIYVVLIIIFIVIFGIGQIVPLTKIEDDYDEFVLPEQDETITLYDSFSYASRRDIIQTLKKNGNAVTYEINEYIINKPIYNAKFKVDDFISKKDILSDGTILDYNGKVLSLSSIDDNSYSIKVINFDLLKVTLLVNQEESLSVFINQEVILYYSDYTFTGLVSSIGKEFINGQLGVDINFDSSEELKVLKPGSNLDISFKIREKKDALTIPKQSVYYINNSPYVDVIDDSSMNETLIQKKILIGIEGDFLVQVIDGLDEGTKVVLTKGAVND